MAYKSDIEASGYLEMGKNVLEKSNMILNRAKDLLLKVNLEGHPTKMVNMAKHERGPNTFCT